MLIGCLKKYTTHLDVHLLLSDFWSLAPFIVQKVTQISRKQGRVVSWDCGQQINSFGESLRASFRLSSTSLIVKAKLTAICWNSDIMYINLSSKHKLFKLTSCKLSGRLMNNIHVLGKFLMNKIIPRKSIIQSREFLHLWKDQGTFSG